MSNKPLSVDQALIKAKSLARKGELNQAMEVYRAVLEKFPGNKRAIEGLKSLTRPKPDQEQIVSDKAPAQQQINDLIALYNQGRNQEALERGTALAERYPNVPLIPNILGAASTAMGRLEEAVTNHSKALQLKPDYAEAHNYLGAALKTLGRHEEAITSLNKALLLKPDYAEAHNNLGNALKALGRHKEAIASYTKALIIQPGLAVAHYNLGNALKALGEHEDAVASYKKALQIRPDYADAHSNLGNALEALGKHEKAIASYSKALQLKPDYAEAHNNLARALNNLGKHEQAITSLTKALQLKPDYAEAHNNLAHALNNLGNQKQAITSLNKALQLKPDYAEAHRNLGSLKKYKTGDPQIAQMQAQIADRSTSENDKMQLSFALGKAYDDIGDAESSFQHFLEGNNLRKQELGYDISSDKRLFSLIKSIFAADRLPTLEEIQPVTEHTKQPVFIVGMPRSGTTLVEQILASHSQVHGAGELDALSQIITPIINKFNKTHFGGLTRDIIIDVRKNYLSELNRLSETAPNITDKMPLNFMWTGFILTAMPEAKIINLQRDPVATCWSIFKRYFTSKGNGYAYDLVDAAEFYNMYINLMVFWRGKFPNQIYDLNYEALTENQEDETRRLLKYCGLGWEDQCLEFHKTKRAVKTASSAQVRQAMYKGSSGAWRKYEAHLQPMLRVLQG